MRAYLPVARAQLAALQEQGQIDGPLRACTVDPQWRTGDPSVDEEEWEYEAQSLAAHALSEAAGDESGVILAVDVGDGAHPADGWFVVDGPVRRTDVAAVLTADLAWFGVQEIPSLLDR
jgi:hypothetical protein